MRCFRTGEFGAKFDGNNKHEWIQARQDLQAQSGSGKEQKCPVVVQVLVCTLLFRVFKCLQCGINVLPKLDMLRAQLTNLPHVLQTSGSEKCKNSFTSVCDNSRCAPPPKRRINTSVDLASNTGWSERVMIIIIQETVRVDSRQLNDIL